MNVGTTEILHDDWASELDQFSAVHRGWLVEVEWESPVMGAQPEIVDVPLISLSYDAQARGAIRLSAGRTPLDSVTHVIDGPRRVWIERTPEGADVALAIETGDGSREILRFRTVALPETVDGVAGWP